MFVLEKESRGSGDKEAASGDGEDEVDIKIFDDNKFYDARNTVY